MKLSGFPSSNTVFHMLHLCVLLFIFLEIRADVWDQQDSCSIPSTHLIISQRCCIQMLPPFLVSVFCNFALLNVICREVQCVIHALLESWSCLCSRKKQIFLILVLRDQRKGVIVFLQLTYNNQNALGLHRTAKHSGWWVMYCKLGGAWFWLVHFQARKKAAWSQTLRHLNSRLKYVSENTWGKKYAIQ